MAHQTRTQITHCVFHFFNGDSLWLTLTLTLTLALALTLTLALALALALVLTTNESTIFYPNQTNYSSGQ